MWRQLVFRLNERILTYSEVNDCDRPSWRHKMNLLHYPEFVPFSGHCMHAHSHYNVNMLILQWLNKAGNTQIY